MTEFTPLPSLLGGILIGVAAVVLMAGIGRIAGVSGILGRLIPPLEPGDAAWRIAFLAGLLGAPFAYRFAIGHAPEIAISPNTVLMAAAGLLVGLGAGLANGCTSGHGVCGTARLSARSIVATLTFMATAIATVYIVRHVIGGL